MGEKVRGGGMAEADMGEGMQCSDHPYRSNPGGICAFCLQEKLGKLVSSSKSSVDPFFSLPPPPFSSSSPPTFISSDPPESSSSTAISFLSSKHYRRRHKKKTSTTTATATRKAATTGTNPAAAVLKKCKSVAPRPIGPPALADASDSPRKKSFWSFLTMSYSSSAIPSVSTKQRSTSSVLSSIAAAGDLPKAVKMDEKTSRREHQEDASVSAASAAGEDDISPSGSQASSSFGRKVSRSRSVGCGSRSFSGDFLERISNGFGDCTLRRVESHRESKFKASVHRRNRQGNADDEAQIKERVKCGGFFGGLGMISSSTYWLSATADVDADAFDDCPPTTRRCGAPHGRTKSWGWAFSSPMRAFRPAGSGSGSVGQTTVLAANDGRGGSSNGSMLVVRGN